MGAKPSSLGLPGLALVRDIMVLHNRRFSAVSMVWTGVVTPMDREVAEQGQGLSKPVSPKIYRNISVRHLGYAISEIRKNSNAIYLRICSALYEIAPYHPQYN